MHRKLATAAAAALLLAMPAISVAATTTSPPQSPPSVAVFEGDLIDLSQGWGEAQACLVAQNARVIECFRDRAGLQARETQLQAGLLAPTT